MNNLIRVDDKNLVVYPPRYPSRECRDAGGSWDGRERAWRFPRYCVYLETVRDLYPGIQEDPTVATLEPHPNGRVSAWASTISRNGAQTPLQETFAKLYPFQREAVGALLDAPHDGVLLALSPGLGKTLVSLVTASILKADSVLVVAPLSLLETWRLEAKRWLQRDMVILHKNVPDLVTPGWVITNYDTIVRREADYLSVAWDVVILDESVLIKNRKTKRFKAACQMSWAAERTWLLSGSPTTKYADDLWSQLHCIDPKGFKSYWRFTQRYCHVETTPFGTQVSGTKQSQNVAKDLRDVMFVRNQKDVLSDLPDYIEKPVAVQLTPGQRKAHDDMLHKFQTELETGEELSAAIVLSQLIRLQQITSSMANVDDGNVDSAKADAIEDLVDSGDVEFPMLVWTQWKPGAGALAYRLGEKYGHLRVRCITGDNTKQVNDDLFAEYKSGGIDVLILSLGIGKFGHTLTNTKTVIYHDLSWNADDYVQSVHRVKRIGLTHSPVLVRLHAVNSVDELVEQNLAGKLPSISSISNADLSTLLKGIGGMS